MSVILHHARRSLSKRISSLTRVRLSVISSGKDVEDSHQCYVLREQNGLLKGQMPKTGGRLQRTQTITCLGQRRGAPNCKPHLGDTPGAHFIFLSFYGQYFVCLLRDRESQCTLGWTHSFGIAQGSLELDILVP